MSKINVALAVFLGFIVGAVLPEQVVVAKQSLPSGFVDAREVIPQLVVDLRYLTEDNFMGQPVDGYVEPRCILTEETATALKGVQAELSEFEMGLKVFDAYRPQRAVDHFVRWAKDPDAPGRKQRFYPQVEKRNLFREGYIATKSGHSRGSTIDLTIVSFPENGPPIELDMGTRFDFFGRESWTDHRGLTTQQRANRLLLRALMQKHGFRPYAKEWWHFTLVDEPYPNQYFDFPVR